MGYSNGKGAEEPFDQTTTIPLRALERDYIRFYPPGLDGPIVIFLHTWMVSASEQGQILGFVFQTAMIIQRLSHGGTYPTFFHSRSRCW